MYLWCLDASETVEHTILKYANYSAERAELEAKLGKPIDPENVRSILYGDARVDLIVNEALRGKWNVRKRH